MLIPGLPRTLIGLGGVRLINLPGVKYPESMFNAEKGMNSLTGKPYKTPPEGSITGAAAARILHRSLSSTYHFLRKHDVTFYYVEDEREHIRTYWQYSEVKELEASLPKVELEVPKTLIKAKDVIRILGVVRSTLYRYVKSGKITEIRRRVMTSRGYRHQSLFIRAEIMNLKAWRNARQQKIITWETYRKQQTEQAES